MDSSHHVLDSTVSLTDIKSETSINVSTKHSTVRIHNYININKNNWDRLTLPTIYKLLLCHAINSISL